MRGLIAPTRLVPPTDPPVTPLDSGCACRCRRRSGRWRHEDHCPVVAGWAGMDDAVRRGLARLGVGR
jgi:hypothetical protein